MTISLEVITREQVGNNPLRYWSLKLWLLGEIVMFLTMDAVVFHIVAAITSADNVFLLEVTCFCKPFEKKTNYKRKR